MNNIQSKAEITVESAESDQAQKKLKKAIDRSDGTWYLGITTETRVTKNPRQR